ncbi:hypothetical protein LZ32DRAFT_601274 [Colletotrichum eremochloae]|nr:hypothetical protein LZ32DRAFT_601274 [Colletotrichum eremochloae]
MPPSPSDALASLSTSLLDHDYRWRLANARYLPRSWTRTAVGAEAWLGRSGFLSTTNYNTYIRTTLSIWSPGISLAHLEYGMSRALVHLRFYRPEIACVSRTFQNDDYPGCPPEITYTVAKDAADVAAWPSRTIHMARRPRHTFQHLSTFKVSDADVQPLSSFKIFFVLGTEQDETAEINVGSRVDLVFVFHPILWDAISSRIFVGDLLRYTVSLWSATTPQLETLRQYNWGTETDNLASSLLEASATAVYATSCDYVKTRDEHMRKLQQGAVSCPCSRLSFASAPHIDSLTGWLGTSPKQSPWQAQNNSTQPLQRRMPPAKAGSQALFRSRLYPDSSWPCRHASRPAPCQPHATTLSQFKPSGLANASKRPALSEGHRRSPSLRFVSSHCFY